MRAEPVKDAWYSAQHSGERHKSWLFSPLVDWYHHGTYTVGLVMDRMFVSPKFMY